MREEIKKQFKWGESLSGSDVSSLACKDQWIEDRPGYQDSQAAKQSGRRRGKGQDIKVNMNA